MKTKIGYLCSSESWGGLEMNQLRNARWMQQRGHAVVILCVKDAPLYLHAISENIPVILVEKHRKYYDYGAGLNLRNCIRDAAITHLIIRDTLEMSICAIAKRFARKHPFHLSYFMEMQLGVNKTNFLHTVRLRALDLWSCPLEWLEKQVHTMTRFFPSKTVVIPSGMELAPFFSEQTQAEARKLLELPEGKTIIGLIGRFDPHKGQLLLLEALKSIKDKSVCVCLLGEPTRNEGTDYFERISQAIRENQLEERVFIRPFRADIASFYRAVDASVMASKSESFGMVTIEAMASGTPTIGSDAGGTPEILKYGELGYLFETLNPVSLAAAIEKFMENPQAIPASKLQENARAYDHHKVCEQVEKALQITSAQVTV